MKKGGIGPLGDRLAYEVFRRAVMFGVQRDQTQHVEAVGMARVCGKNPSVYFFGFRQISAVLKLQRLVKKRRDIIGSCGLLFGRHFSFSAQYLRHISR